MLDLIIEAYKKSKKRILFLDYDGTLVSYTKMPSEANIGEDTFAILEHLSMDLKNSIFIISGRDMRFLEGQFTGLNVNLIAEHGYSIKEPGQSSKIINPVDMDWKETFRYLFKTFTKEIPGTLIEEKESSVAFHYRNAEYEIDAHTLSTVQERIKSTMEKKLGLEMLEGNKVVEVKMAVYNKGTVATTFLKKRAYDFILAAGDDVTDESLFRELKNNAFTVKVGNGKTSAGFRIEDPSRFMTFLSDLADNKSND